MTSYTPEIVVGSAIVTALGVAAYMVAPANYTIICVVEGENIPFPVDIRQDAIIGHLKDAIKKKKLPEFESFAANKLKLFKVDVPTSAEIASLELSSKEMNPMLALKKYYAAAPPEETIHVLVRVPKNAFIASQPAWIDSGSHSLRLSGSGSGDSHQSKVLQRVGSPINIDSLIPRTATVEALYEKLKETHFIQVRGTPASGKTSLSRLLMAKIEEDPPQPNCVLIYITSWPEKGPYWRERLKEKGFETHQCNIMMFDEGQTSYWDQELWNDCFKSVLSDRHDYVIVFASYGSPSFVATQTPWTIPEANRVSLRPQNGAGMIGLLLRREEFDALMKKRWPGSSFDSTFLGSTFEITNGHVGAIVDFVDLVRASDSYRDAEKHQEPYTWAKFVQNISTQDLFNKLEGMSIFRRGLPQLEPLQNPALAHVFRTVLSRGSVQESTFDSEDHKSTLNFCFRNGWLHADKLASDPPHRDSGRVLYFFASTLHQWFIEFQLGMWFQANEIKEAKPLDLALNIIKRYSPHQFRAKRIGASFVQRTPEAQYQDEFYRRFHAYTGGSLLSFPEFGTQKGRIDFYIPSKKWGVELTREGDRLIGHSSRFAKGGTYAETLSLEDYIILDFRTTRPSRPHHDIPNLYHVVFDREFKTVEIMDNSLTSQKSFSLVNHA